VLASVRSACVGTVLGMIVAACSSEMTDSRNQAEVVVNILPDGDRCTVRGVELACSDVPAHLRNVLKLGVWHPVSVRAESSHPTFEQINALFDGLRKAQFGLKVGYLTSPETPIPDWIESARAERSEIKKKYGRLFEEVSAILQRYDPIGIAAGAPSDEYDAEAGTIIPRLKECRSDRDVQTVVFEEFGRWFGKDIAGAREIYAQPSKEIWLAWKSFNEKPAT
jgi:hypothetical protein